MTHIHFSLFYTKIIWLFSGFGTSEGQKKIFKDIRRFNIGLKDTVMDTSLYLIRKSIANDYN